MDDGLKMLLDNLQDEGVATRASVAALASSIHRTELASQRVETRLVEVLDRMRQGDADHRRLADRLEAVEAKAVQVQAWSAGAAAVTVAILGGIGWIASHMPTLMKVVER